MRCCSAWNSPISLPNCLRSFRYCAVRENASSADAEHFGGDHRAADVQDAVEHGAALIDFAEHAVRGHLGIVEGDPRRVVRIHHDGALDVDALGLRIDQEQGDALGLLVAAGGARRHDQHVGHVAIDDEGLCALQLETVAGAGGLQRNRVRTMLWPLIDRERADDRSVGDLRQILALLRLAAGARKRRRREHRGCQERRRHQRVADLLGDNPGLDAAERGAAELFRHQQAGKAHLAESLPEVAGEAVLVLGIAQRAEMRHRRLVGDQAARAVAQQRLFFSEDEGHGSTGCFL